ncbi:MAG: hypothetical protein NTX29_05090, partial [Actinobacteria bacterium]|nr:hypothetical protein [Actinomycetota bacterium]
MRYEHSLTRIVVVPRNGYVNRLQAWASASILARTLDVPLQVLWEPQPAAGAPADLLFTIDTSTFVSAADATALFGQPHDDLPRLLTVLPERRLVVLAGHDLGEQAFMSELPAALAHPSRPETLVIIAGGKFCLPTDEETFVGQRADFYQGIDWAPGLADPVNARVREHPAYLAVHLRYTDRAYQAPLKREIIRALESLREETSLTDLFVAADSARTRANWVDMATGRGFAPWTSEAGSFDRASADAGLPAMTDWLLLTHSRGLVYFNASSFAEEAAVATGTFDACVGLAPSRTRHDVLKARDFLRSGLTYPARRWTARR